MEIVANEQAERRIVEHQESKQHLLDHVHIMRKRCTEDAAARGTLVRMSACRLTDADLNGIAALWVAGKYSRVYVNAARDKALEGPVALKEPLASMLTRCELKEHDAPPSATPGSWVGAITRAREHFLDTALVFTEESRVLQSMVILYGLQAPYVLGVLNATIVQPVIDAEGLEDAETLEETMMTRMKWHLSVGDRVFHNFTGVEPLPIANVLAIPGFRRERGGLLVSDCDAVPLSEHLEALPQKVREAKEGTGESEKKKARKKSIEEEVAEEDLLKKMFPGVAKLLSDPDAPPMDPVPTREGDEDAEEELLPAGAENAWRNVQRLRAEWGLGGAGDGREFRADFRGGTSTFVKKLVDADYVWGEAKGPFAPEWCNMYRQYKSKSFQIRRFGIPAAVCLSRAWCARMQGFL